MPRSHSHCRCGKIGQYTGDESSGQGIAHIVCHPGEVELIDTLGPILPEGNHWRDGVFRYQASGPGGYTASVNDIERQNATIHQLHGHGTSQGGGIDTTHAIYHHINLDGWGGAGIGERVENIKGLGIEYRQQGGRNHYLVRRGSCNGWSHTVINDRSIDGEDAA